ncbi:hypothetical protein BVRB_3g057580 [Beta vulgaris subsp. vulgaris]|nr:hypothetical protein BVRB_3g057580 [Beta vulgaris subsp. vulgaris]
MPPPTSKRLRTTAHPRFFQPLCRDFLSNFKIPVSFLKFLGGDEDEIGGAKIAKLRDKTRSHVWNVKVGCDRRRLEDGWVKFCKDHNLQMGNFLVFKHLGNFVFDVIILDGIGCESELPIITEDEESQATRGNRKLGDGDGQGLQEKICASLRSNNGRPYFSSIVTPSNLTSGITAIPKQFAIKNGLTRRWCDIELRDDKGQSRRMKLRFSKESGCSYIYSRPTLYEPYDLVRGDIIIFELIDNGKNPAMKFYSKLQ